MISIYNLKESVPLFQALGSEIRVRILNLIALEAGITIKQISQKAGIPATTLTRHIQILEDCGLICPISCYGHNTVKYYPTKKVDQILIHLGPQKKESSVYKTEIPIGHYCDFSVTPTCGLASGQAFIGQLDEPRYFAHPSRYLAEILWFSTGYVEYLLPNFIPRHSRITQLCISFEISSEAPTHNNVWPSDVTFSLNDTVLGAWTSPGDYGDRRGLLNPDWWYSFLNQYGLLKKLVINSSGTFLNEERLSDVSIDTLDLTDQSILHFRFQVLPGPKAGGCTLYGPAFGDHNQALLLEIAYEAI